MRRTKANMVLILGGDLHGLNYKLQVQTEEGKLIENLIGNRKDKQTSPEKR